MDYKIIDVATLLNCEIKGDKELLIKGISPFFQASEEELTFASDEKFLKKIDETKAKVVLVPNIELPNNGKTYLVTSKSPRELMPLLLKFFKKEIKKMEKPIEDSAIIGDNVEIGPNVYIGHDVVIGKNTIIYPNTTICQGSIIGENCLIYSGVQIREYTDIGNRAIIQPGAVIGSDGFGFVKVNGNNMKIDQIGRVIIEDDVEIGANCTIDRGAIGNTIIKQYAKLDNLFHIAHNVIIGENFLGAGQGGIAGSAEIGKNVTFGGQVGIGGHIKIPKGTTVAGKSVITGNLKEENQILGGNPAIPLTEDLKVRTSMRKLPELLKRMRKVEKKLEE